MIFNKSKYICFIIDKSFNLSLRLDKLICKYYNIYNRSEIKKVFLNKNIFVNNKNVLAKYIAKLGDEICFLKKENKSTSIKPIKIKLNIIYEDEHIIAINKDHGLIVYPPKNNKEITSLVNGVIYYTKGNISYVEGLEYRPGIVHRLDKDTSGIIILAKSKQSQLGLMKLFYEKKVYKEYIAIVEGHIKNDKGVISFPIMRHPKIKIKMTTDSKGKEAITKWSFIKYFENYSIIKCIPITGRTHQIRVHLNSIGHPIIGDKIYRNKINNFKRMFLHAYLISFIHPINNKKITLKAPIPKEFDDYIKIN